ncbi:MAG TPA: hypothetical protein VFM25_01495 [Verrucomicrobiae bacterium]|nr:hypothetical protein [Verrucomicrobiae bacterium]
MNQKNSWLIILAAGFGVVAIFLWYLDSLEKNDQTPSALSIASDTNRVGSQSMSQTHSVSSVNVESPVPVTNAASGPEIRVKHQASNFTPEEKAEFLSNFERKYRPAIQKWCTAYEGHVPFSPDEITPKEFAERVGIDSSYGEYIFVVNGITLGVQDKKGVARVDYLNAPKQTRKMAMVPNGDDVPITTSPVQREEVMKMIQADGGGQFDPSEIRLIPTGLSGALNGGVIVSVGGDPNNSASWKFDMVFGPDDKLAYYLRGI